ncbi:MAG: amino acid ABC transporter ATP-binding protein [Lachnospiraceae bacterium]|nr:amino acid ABC transporter ATP-binding protein [Lachnospiraceae bacterium]MDD7047520.1 amino acid ABC transporter ATP-binding protein [Lachnospiraceae bacterium]
MSERETATVISMKNVVKKFGKLTVLDDISLDVKEHEIVVLCGPSGGGKSTLLRTINGLEKINSGTISYRGNLITNKNIREVRKHVGMVFQSFNLFNNLTILDNLTIAPIKLLGIKKDEAVEKAQKYMDTFGIGDKMSSYPHQLSGGQKQRVAIVRSMMMEPDVILFDEPTSALDPEMIREVLDAIRRLADMGMTMMIVTHEISFAKEVSTRMLFLEKSKIRVDKPTEEFFNHVEDERLQQFLSVILKH